MKNLSLYLFSLILSSQLMAATYNLTNGDRPPCSTNSWSVSGTTYTCTGGNGKITLFSGDIVISSSNATLSANAGFSIAGVTIGSSSVTINLVSTYGDMDIDNSNVYGIIQSNSGNFTLKNTDVTGSITTSGNINITGGAIDGKVTSSSNTITANNTNLLGGSVAHSGMSINNSTISGDFALTSNNSLSLDGVNMQSGSISYAQTIFISNSNLGNVSSLIDINSNGHIYVQNNSTVYGNLTAATWTNTQTIHVDDSSEVLGSCNHNVGYPCTELIAPILDYRFDECEWNGTVGEVKDSSGNDRNGTSGAANTIDSHRVINRSADFSDDGRNDYVSVDSSAFDGLNDFSVSVWVKTSNTGSQQEIIQALGRNASDDEFELYLRRNDEIIIKLFDEAKVFELSSNEITDGEWHQIFVTRRGEEICLYIDGNLKDCEDGFRTRALSVSENGVILGQEQDSIGGSFDRDQNFVGFMDELKVFDTTLSAQNISKIYDNENSGKNYDGNSRSPVNCFGPVPIVEYRFDECKWDGMLGEVKDSSGSGNDGTSEGAVLFEDGVLNSAANFDGSGTIETGDILALRNSATLSFWIKTTQSGDNTTWNAPGVVGVEQSGGGDDIIWGFIDAYGKIGIDVGTTRSSYAKSSTSINNNIFHHIVLSRDGASGEVKVYVNGVLEDTESLKTGEIGNSFTKLGIIRDTGGSHEYLNATIDEFKVFDTVLSDAQVRDIYNYEKEGENYDGSGERASVDCSVVSLCYEDNFNRADLGSKWSIIKAYNFTPSVINNKLVLTEDSNNIAAGVSLIGTFPSNNNLVEIEFEHNAYARTNGADGVTVVLSDGNITPVAGAYGGSLGYAQRGGHDGFQGGWLGFGIDEFGNFANDSEGRGSGCSSHPPSGRILDSITIRGRQGSSLRNGYCFIANSGVLDPQIDDKDPRNHKYKFIIDTRGGTKITVQRDTNDGNGYVTLPNMNEVDATQTAAAPPTFRLSFTGSTGGSRNWHTLDDLTVKAIGCGSLGKDQNNTKNNFFDAWDTSGDIAAREIKTKIVREDFELNVVALNDTNTTYQDFNGTVCTRLIDVISDSNITNWQKTLFTGANLQKQTYNSTYASKEAKVEIAWKDGVDEVCPLGSDFNITRSTDNFAIRPDRFEFASAGDRFAGEDFILDISALGASGNDALAYSETKDSSFEILSTIAKAGCANGVLSIANFTFADGAQSIDANYSENGDVNITIQEISGSEFANIDSGDTPLADRLITPVTKTISIKPYELNITRADYIASTGSDWLYMADVSDMNVTASAIVQANNKQHQALQNFDALCYASDVDLDFKYSVVNPNSDINISYIPSFLGLEQDIVNIDKTITIADSNFTSGVANVQYSFNINRSQDIPLSPVDISLEDVEVASTDVAKDENNATVGINKTFLYGRLRAYDVETSIKPEVEVPLFIEVYDPSGSFDDVWQENSLNWYTNKWHTNSSFGELKDINSTKINKDFSDIENDVTRENTSHFEGIVNLTLKHNFTEATKRTIHLDISPWLWHLPGNNANTYDYSLSSTCKEHPCFEFYYYPFSATGVGNAVHSGSAKGFGGSDFNLTDTKRTQQGVKVFR